jgi:hypothetical protein
MHATSFVVLPGVVPHDENELESSPLYFTNHHNIEIQII